MRPHPSCWSPRMAALGAMLTMASRSHSSSAAADDARCTGPDLVVRDPLPSTWAEAVDDVRVQLKRQGRFDACARLILTPVEEKILVQIVLADGRAASREVPTPKTLWRTVRAVLLLPPVTLSLARPRPASDGRKNWVDTAEPELHSPENPSHAHFELGGGGSARVSGGPLYGGTGASAFADVLLDSWLIGVFGRWDVADALVTAAPPGGFSMQSFGVGVLLGARMSIGGWSLDGTAGPDIVVDSQEGDGPGDGIGGEADDVRLDVGLRLSGPSTSRLRFYLAADLDASPARIRRTAQIDPGLPGLPAWSAGLTMGLLWSAL